MNEPIYLAQILKVSRGDIQHYMIDKLLYENYQSYFKYQAIEIAVPHIHNPEHKQALYTLMESAIDDLETSNHHQHILNLATKHK